MEVFSSLGRKTMLPMATFFSDKAVREVESDRLREFDLCEDVDDWRDLWVGVDCWCFETLF